MSRFTSPPITITNDAMQHLVSSDRKIKPVSSASLRQMKSGSTAPVRTSRLVLLYDRLTEASFSRSECKVAFFPGSARMNVTPAPLNMIHTIVGLFAKTTEVFLSVFRQSQILVLLFDIAYSHSFLFDLVFMVTKHRI